MATYKLKITGLVNNPKALSHRRPEEAGQHASWSPASSAPATAARCRGCPATASGPACRSRPCSPPPGSSPRRRTSCSSAPITAKKKSSGARRSTRSTTTSAAACRARRRLSAEPFLAWALNGQPLTKHQGAPLRLLVPGWYGVANVKWLLGDSSAGRQLRRQVPGALVPHGADRDGRRRAEGQRDRSHAHEPEVVRRARHQGAAPRTRCSRSCSTTARRSSRSRSRWTTVRGRWRRRIRRPRTSSAGSSTTTPGTARRPAITPSSRARPTSPGAVQPTEKDLESKKSFLEQNSQAPRKLKIA